MKISIINRGFTVIKGRIRKAELDAIRKNNLDISELQWNYLVWVSENKDKKMGEIAKLLGVQKGTLSNNIKYLIAKGLMTKEEDGRLIKIDITKKGQKYIDIHHETHRKIEEDLLKIISKEELENLISTGLKLREQL